MNIKEKIIFREKKILKQFFNNCFDIPSLPNWINKKKINFWNKNNFNLHYLPKISLKKKLNLRSWKDKPSNFLYKKIKEGTIKKEAINLPGKWLLIDSRDKPKKRVLWIQSKEVDFLKKFNLNPKKFFEKWSKQQYYNDFLMPVLKEKGNNSRFCLTIYEIKKLNSFITDFLKVKNKKIRLPYFIEYNYLGNAIYNQWKKTKTWEWLEDKLKNGQHLASGYQSTGIIGFDPPNFWSTILSFRPVIEIT